MNAITEAVPKLDLARSYLREAEKALEKAATSRDLFQIGSAHYKVLVAAGLLKENDPAPAGSADEAGPATDVLVGFFGEVVESYDTSLTWGHPPDRRLVITVPVDVIRAMRAIRETDSNATRGAGASERPPVAVVDSKEVCPHGYRLEDLRTGASVCERCEDRDGKPKLSFEELKRTTAADLREVARLINERADEVAAGDMAAMDKLMAEDLQKLYEMLLIRYTHRQEARDG